MIISNNIFLIRKFSRNLGHLDLKLVEGKRSGSWRTSTTCVWPADGFLYKCICWIGFWTVSHLWYYDIFLFSSLDGMQQRTPRHHCKFSLDELKIAKASLVCNVFLESIAKTFKEHPKAPYAQEKSLGSIWHLISNGAAQTESETFSFISTRLRNT